MLFLFHDLLFEVAFTTKCLISFTEWVKEKQRITSTLKLAVGKPEPVPFLLAAKQAGAFDDAYFVYADNRAIFAHPMPEGYSGTGRPWYQQAVKAGGQPNPSLRRC